MPLKELIVIVSMCILGNTAKIVRKKAQM